MRGTAVGIGFGLVMLGLLAAAPSALAQSTASPGTTAALPAIPDDKITDIKFYAPNAPVATGQSAFDQMPHADLAIWVAGNQFFAMDDVIGTFQKTHPGLGVGLITLPPGLVLQAIKAGGWTFRGNAIHMRPDIYGSVSLGHLRELKAAGLMDSYRVYMHNELQIVVAKGNPKHVAGIDDLGREDVRISLPNPVNEGIMQFYLRKVLETHGLWQKISAGKECISCATTANTWFTAVHHRETPQRLKSGQSDAGVVWKTEVMEALRHGDTVEPIELPPQDSLRDEISYTTGMLTSTSHPDAAKAYLDYLGSDDGQSAYARYGFVRATADELKPKPID